VLAVTLTLAALTRRAALIVARVLRAATLTVAGVTPESATVAVHITVAVGTWVAVAPAERKIAARAAAASIAPALATAEALSAPGLPLVHREFGNRSGRRRVIFRAWQGGAYQGSMPDPATRQLVATRLVALVT
jgi:hypothetical protein